MGRGGTDEAALAGAGVEALRITQPRALTSRTSLAALPARRASANRQLSAAIQLLDYQHSVECAYERVTDDCQCGDYCRCSRLEDVRVESVHIGDPFDLAAEAYQAKVAGFSSSRFEQVGPSAHRKEMYAIERLLAVRPPFVEDFEATVGPGLYGEEIERVDLIGSTAARALAAIDLRSPSQMIQALLEEEYGTLPDRLRGRDWKAAKIPISEISRPQREHAAAVSESAVRIYGSRFEANRSVWLPKIPDELRAREIPQGVAVSDGTGVSLQDGYHRVAAAEAAGLSEVWLWVG